MATINVTPARVAPVFLDFCRIRSFLAGLGGIVAGQPFYVTANGVILPTVASAAGQYQFRGIALNTAGQGQAVDGLCEGFVEGFDLSGLAFDALAYLNDAAGTIGTAAGTNSVTVGRVCPVSDRDPATGKPSKLLFVRSDMVKNW